MDLISNMKLLGFIIGCSICLRWTYWLFYSGRIVLDLWMLLLLLALAVIFDILRLRPGQYQRTSGLLRQYVTQKILLAIGFFVQKRFDKMSEHILEQQTTLLKGILQQNKNTDVAKVLGADNVKTEEEFRRKVPLTTYTDYQDCANKIEQSECQNVFFPGVVDYMAYTSGTTSGKSKKFPKSLQIMRNTAARWLLLAQKKSFLVPKNNYLRHWLAVKFAPKTWKSASGITCGPISGLFSKYSLNSYIVPDVTDDVHDDDTVIYINLVFGLKYADICNLYFSTAQVALIFLQTLERKWKQLCDDIENGALSEKLILSSELRLFLNMALKGGNSERANLLRNEFSRGFQNIVPRVWPECPGIFCMATGSFQTPADVLRKRYMGHVPLISPFHAGTESFYGLNLDLLQPDVTYTLMVPFNYFEFIPVEQTEEENPGTKLCHQVTVGKQYELVVTTWEGLYRYRTEDVVEITGFYGTIPCYKFIRRTSEILSLTTEKVPEVLLSEAIRTSACAWKKSVIEFVSTENTYVEKLQDCVSDLFYYIVFIEIHSDEILSEESKHMVDQHLIKLHDMYEKFRATGRIKPVRLIQVSSGTFESLAKLARTLNEESSMMQSKVPRIVRKDELLRHLIGCMLPSQYVFPEFSHG